MKTNLKHISRRTISLILCVLMLFSTLMVGSISTANAASITSDGSSILFFNRSAISWWPATGNFAYFYGTSGNAWSKNAIQASDNIYYVKIPSGTWDHVILTRNNTITSPNFTQGNNLWNKTGDIAIQDGKNYISSFSENNTSATWDTYQPTSNAKLDASATTVETGESVTLTPSLTDYTTYNVIKDVSYAISPESGATINKNADKSATFTATTAGTYTVTATVTYNAKGFTGITKTAMASQTITVNAAQSSSLQVYVTGTAASKTWGEWAKLSNNTSDGSVAYIQINRGQEFKVSTKDEWNQYDGIKIDNTKGNVDIKGEFSNSTNLSTEGEGNIYLCVELSTGSIYAQTDDPSNVTTYYPVNFGASGSGTVSAQVGSNTIANGSRQPSGAEVKFTANATDGYELEGWYSDSTCTTPISGASGTTYTTSVNSETNVYAKFKETLHTVSIAGGTETSTQAGIATKGIATVDIPSGKIFKNWTIPEGITLTDGTTANSETIKFTATSDNLTVTANFEDIYAVTVTKSTGVASFTPETIASQKANAVVTITPTYSDGYEYAAPTVTNGSFVQDGNNIKVTVSGTGPVTIQLNASPKTFNVTFNSDGGSECSAVQATYNSTYPTLPRPTKDGYTFDGWFIGDNQITEDVTVSITSDTELQAHWTIKTPTITGAPTQITARAGEQFTVTGVTTDSFADLSYTFNDANNTTGTFTAPATSGTYTLKITATHKNDNTVKATSTVNVNVSDAFTTASADVTYYVDMHTNTGTPSIVVNGVEKALTKQGDSTVYSATVSTPYTLNNETAQPTEISGNIGMKVGDAVYPVNGLGVDCIRTREVWLEANGKLSTTKVQVKKTETNGAAGGKRVYFTNTKGWTNVYLYAYNSTGGKNHDWPGVEINSTGWKDQLTDKYIYYANVASTFENIVFSNGNSGENQTVDISLSNVTATSNNHFYISGQVSGGNDNGKQNVGTTSTTAPKISKYYSEVVLSKDDTNIDLMPSVFSAANITEESGTRKNIYFEVTSGPDVISVDPKTGVITPLKAGSAVVTITVYGSYSYNGSDSDSVTANVIVGENTVVGGFDVMSYNSVQSTFTAENGSISSVSTSLVGSKFSSLPISGAGIVTNDGNTYTVLYAAANSTTGYGSLKLNVTAVSQPSADTYEFKKWTKDSVDTTGSATATFPVDGGAYKAVYEQVARTTITITYKYEVYNTSDGIYYYDPKKENATNEVTQTYTTSVIGTPTEAEIKEIAAANVPNNLDNDYFDYSFNSSNVVVNGTNATVTLKETPHQYSVYIMSSKKTIKYERTYQHFIDASSTDFGFAEGTDVIWYQSNKNGDLVSVLSTGTNYRFRAVADNQYIYVVENKDQVSMNGSSVVVSTGNKITTVNNIDKLNQDFYIADYFNGYAMGHDDVQFLGAGVMYYSVDANTGAPSNKTLADSGLVNSSGVGYTTAMEQFLVNRLGTFDNSVNVTTDSTTKLGYRYLTAADGAKIFRYSDALEAYQYIFTLTFTNSAANVSKNVRLYSYFVYSYTDGSGGTQYVVSISDGYAQAQMYVSK